MSTGQRYTDVVISGLAHVDASYAVTSAEIEAQLAPTLERLGVRPGLLADLTGIQERRVWETDTKPSEKAAEAGALALERSGIEPGRIGVLVNTSVIRDYIEPSTASIVHGRLGLPPEAMNFDMGNACLGFVNGMNVVSGMIERGEIDAGLVVNAETTRFAMEATIRRMLTPACDEAMFRQQFATLTVGSGAVGMVLSRSDIADGHRFLGGLSRASTEHALLCTAEPDEMRTDTKGMLLAGLQLARELWKESVDTFDWDPESIDVFALHQISSVHTRGVCDTLGLDIAKFPLIYPHFGNLGPAAVPTVVSKSAENGSLKPGDRLMLLGVGSGINAASAEILW